jgi:hypothetical protein
MHGSRTHKSYLSLRVLTALSLLLQLEKTANLMEIKAAYRQLQKKCHPDILGDEQGHEMSILLNDVRLFCFSSACFLSDPYDSSCGKSRAFSGVSILPQTHCVVCCRRTQCSQMSLQESFTTLIFTVAAWKRSWASQTKHLVSGCQPLTLQEQRTPTPERQERFLWTRLPASGVSSAAGLLRIRLCWMPGMGGRESTTNGLTQKKT